MFTDIVGYSSMVNKDQSHAMELLAMHDKINEPIIKENNGRIIKKIGDAIFAEFSGFSKLVFTLKEITNSLISISTSRIPILFGGMIILEIASGGTLEGIGYLIWDSGFVNQNLRVFYSATVFSIFITSFFFFLADFIDKSVLLKK